MSRLDKNCNTPPITYVSGGNKDLGELKKNEFGTATIMISHSCNLHCTYCFEDCKEMGVHNFKEIFVKFYDMFLMDNSNFMNVFNKYDREDLVEKLERNADIVEFL